MAVKTLVQALNDALRIALRDDPRVFLMGEDIGKYGGVYRVTKDLLDEFGAARVLDTPISESAIAGALDNKIAVATITKCFTLCISTYSL